MLSSRDVFAKRKEGEIDEAYQMALQLMKNSEIDDWDRKAFGWCLIDLIKRDTKLSDFSKIEIYGNQLRPLKVDPSDKVFRDQKEYALKLCNPNAKIILEAKSHSKNGNHQQALNIYRDLIHRGDNSAETHTSAAWELYKTAKSMISQDPANHHGAKRLLNEYLHLNTEKPSLLHSCFLQLADKIAIAGKLNMGAFVSIWNLENLRYEDYEPFITNDGETYPSLAEKVLQHACKDSFSREAKSELIYLLPFVENCISQFPENLWLKLSQTKIYLGIGQSDKARSVGLQVVKNKPNNYWTWELLGDIYAGDEPDISLSCYCKSLLCEKDINFITKVKLKLTNILIARNLLAEAKFEVQEISKFKQEKGQKVPDELTEIINLPWFEGQKELKSNEALYLKYSVNADELLISDMPWKKAVLGEKFTTKSNPNKPRRKIYIEDHNHPIEISIPESRINLPQKRHGLSIALKGEEDLDGRFQIYSLQPREAEDWDIFGKYIGVVDNVNHQKKLLHFMVSRQIDGIIHFSELESIFSLGAAIELRLATYKSKKGTGFRVLTASKTDKSPPSELIKQFESNVSADRGMGFTDDNIFIPPPLMEQHSIYDQCTVNGTAILSYNKKRSEWGWRALEIHSVE
ncbi:DUF7017 domain-containing protein [Pseudemcibacter aquimaris]|uniref:DUF7017 domain-containing protein n=1 Tax=Pseudemcibacter aquimaris TaxID=2857064 RepID=UPI002013A113|nr:hypothetical protein [Pseudemcibacter aquimaris]MCC3862613.1 hypothetical protein [Pseudemcibacter aquimaris]WDU57840.1 hypothetical protein KW060_11595 [Pseudemcibacter aquimaris]